MEADDNEIDVPREERMEQVLELLVSTETALPSTAIYRNCRLRGSTFGRRTVNDYLEELHDRDYVVKVDAGALDNGKIEEVVFGDRGYFIATEKAHQYFEEGSDLEL